MMKKGKIIIFMGIRDSHIGQARPSKPTQIVADQGEMVAQPSLLAFPHSMIQPETMHKYNRLTAPFFKGEKGRPIQIICRQKKSKILLIINIRS
jgi:hypothetical protein